MSVKATRSVWFARSVLAVVSLLVMVPLIYQVGISFKQTDMVFAHPIAPIDFPITLDNYRIVIGQMPIVRYLINSLVFSVAVTGGQILLALPAAFAFSYFRFPGRNVLLAVVLLSLMVPFVVTYIPNYLLIADLNLTRSLGGMILPMLGASLGFGIFLLRQHFMSFQREVMEAAMIDGATSFQILTRVIGPANISPITALAIYILINTWNQFIWPILISGGKPELFTLNVGVQIYYTNPEAGNLLTSVMAAAVLTAMPTVVMYLIMRKGILRTFAEGAIK